MFYFLNSFCISTHEKAERAKKNVMCILAIFAFCLCILFSAFGISFMKADAATLSHGDDIIAFPAIGEGDVVIGSYSSPFGDGDVVMEIYASVGGYMSMYIYPQKLNEGSYNDMFTLEQFYDFNPLFNFNVEVFYTELDSFGISVPVYGPKVFSVYYSDLVDYLSDYTLLKFTPSIVDNELVLQFSPGSGTESYINYSGLPEYVLAEYGRQGYTEFLAQSIYKGTDTASDFEDFKFYMTSSSLSSIDISFFEEYNTPEVIVSNKNTDKIISNADKNSQLIIDTLEDLKENQQDNFDKVYEEQLKGNELLDDISTELEQIYNEGKGNFKPIFDDAYNDKVNQGSNDLSDIENVEKPDFENVVDFDRILSFLSDNLGFSLVMNVLRLVLGHYVISTMLVFAFSFGVIRYVLFGKR